MFTASAARVPESERTRQRLQVHAGAVRATPSAPAAHAKRARKAAIVGTQPSSDCGNNPTTIVSSARTGAHAPAYPAHGAGQRDRIAAQRVGGRLHALGLLDRGDHLLDLGQRAGKARRQMIGQQAERAMTLWAVPARDERSRRRLALVGAVAGKPTAPARMQRAAQKPCLAPALLG